ncbi:hypothetical protein [Glycomyces sp. NPDC048151]|uniref:hypothetical protein n=1 Tax=Glycomyces sp. NPDC048151 TaxID=3364002 RepID=UPI0037170812
MSDSPSKNFWTAVGSMAAVAGVIVTVMMWQEREADGEEPDANASTSDDNGGEDPNPGGGGDPDPESTDDGSEGTWEVSDSYTVYLEATVQEDHCWDFHYDLDDSYGEAADGSSEAPESVDLVWYSCGGNNDAYLYAASEVSAAVPNGESQDASVCSEAVGDDSEFGVYVSPNYQPDAEGCLLTDTGAMAGVAVTYTQFYNDAVEAELTVTLWKWTE